MVDWSTSHDRRSYTFAYYCSGHGYGHATRVVALSHELLLRSHDVHLCTNAPEHIFSTVIARGASYRHAEIDAGIVQPKAYDVARRETVDGLKRFLNSREDKLQKEVEWLKSIQADAVLVDAPFLPCAAAEVAGIPSVIISNFTFDSCYSYLSVSTEADRAALTLSTPPFYPTSGRISPSLSLHDESNGFHSIPSPEEPEAPIPAEVLEPLVNQAIEDYSNASLLLRLPGCIPLPSFDLDAPLPASTWTDLSKHSFKQDIMQLLGRDPASIPCDFEAPSSSQPTGTMTKARRKRRVVDVPLIARPLAKDIHSQKARERVLSYIGVPADLHDPDETKILVVSFGGQSIPRPASRPPSPSKSHSASPTNMSRDDSSEGYLNHRSSRLDDRFDALSMSPPQFTKAYQQNGSLSVSPLASGLVQAAHNDSDNAPEPRPRTRRLMTEHHLYLPGAPPALHQPVSSPLLSNSSSKSSRENRLSLEIPEVQELEIPHNLNGDAEEESFDDDEGLLPDGWLAIVCGLSGKEKDDDLPPGFFAAPRDVYMPDLTATCDVLLGKLGYGTCSETVSTQTPFVYVPRPLFVEEFGLKRLMETSGTALPMSRADFEAGRWSSLIAEAHELGKARKVAHRKQFLDTKGREEIVASTVIAQEVEKFMREQ